MAAFLVSATLAYAAPVKLQARGGNHARYNRIVFDWPVKVKYTLKQSGNNVTILFSKPSKIDFSRVKTARLPFVKDLKQTTTGEVTEISFQIPDNSNVQAFWVGKKVAFDVLRQGTGPLKFSQGKPSVEEITKGPQKPRIIKGEDIPKELAQPKPVAQPKSTPTPSVTEAPIKEITPKVEPAVAQAKKETKPSVALKGKALIRVRPAQDTNMAAFKRNGSLWLVFDKILSGIPPQVTGEMAQYFKDAERISLNKATAYRFDLPEGDTNISVEKVNLNWEITIDQSSKIGNVFTFEPDFLTRPNQPRFFVSMLREPSLITMVDPDAGDRLVVAAMPSGKSYVADDRRYPQFKTLSTELGIVIQPLSDGLSVNALPNGLEITSAEPLKLSDESDRLSSVQKNSPEERKLFDLVGWQAGARENFDRNRQTLEARIVSLEGLSKAGGYTDLAKLYMANGFGAEARGLLKIASTIVPELEKSPDFRALRGASKALAGDFDGAEADLNIAELKDQPEAHLWLGYARGQAHHWRDAHEAFSKAGSIVKSYPPFLRSRIVLTSAEADLHSSDLLGASQSLDSLDYDALMAEADKSTYRYLRGLIATKTDNRDIGMEELERAARGRDALYHAKAELDLVALQLEEGKIELKEATDRLEKLRFAWRGDRLEIRTMQQLGTYYNQDKEYAKGLNVLRIAAGLAAEQEDIDAITQEMASVFSNLYVEDGADDLPPLKALALFNEFRELTPVGDKGNIAIQNLSKRLVEVDLLDQADELLVEQLRFRTSGAEASEVGTRLAVIRLLAEQPKGALQALQESENDEISKDLKTKRNVIRARALADSGQVDEALNSLRGNTSDEATQLKADINWRDGRWDAAVSALDVLISRHIAGNNEDSKGLSDLVLKKGIALALGGDEVALKRLKATYSSYVNETDHAAAFDLITQPLRGSTLSDLATLKAQVAEVELFENFLENYR